MTDAIHTEPAPTLEEVWQLFKEIAQRFQETDQRFQETEVKSYLDRDSVNEHIERMGKFKTAFPLYADNKVYGAVAAMVIPDNVAKYAYRQGLFVIAQKGNTAIFLNDMKFHPKVW